VGWREWWEKLRRRRGTEGEVRPAAVPAPLRRSRGEQIALLQAGYEEMVELARTVRSHLEKQAEVQNRLLSVLEKLPESLETVSRLGEGARRQAEVLESIRENLHKAAEEDRHLAEGLDRFGRVLEQMEETTRGTTRTVARLMEYSRESEEMLKELVLRSERRVTYLVTILAVIAALAAGALVMVFAPWRTQRPGSGSAVVSGQRPPPSAGTPELTHSIVDLEASGPSGPAKGEAGGPESEGR